MSKSVLKFVLAGLAVAFAVAAGPRHGVAEVRSTYKAPAHKKKAHKPEKMQGFNLKDLDSPLKKGEVASSSASKKRRLCRTCQNVK